jgi:hypothetical protein
LFQHHLYRETGILFIIYYQYPPFFSRHLFSLKTRPISELLFVLNVPV